MSAADNDTPVREWARTGRVRFERDVTPLEMARDWAKRTYQIADHYAQREQADPGFGKIEAHIHGAGRQQYEAAQMASFMALVSIAEDLHAVVGALADLAGQAAGQHHAQDGDEP